MSRETDLTCYESMNRSKKSDAIVNGQSLLRMWNCPAFLSAICMGLHKRLGNTSQLQLLGKEPQLLEDVCKMLRVISLSEILSIFSCDWKPELFQHSFFLGPLGAHVPQGSLGAMARVSSGGLVLQVFAGSTDGQPRPGRRARTAAREGETRPGAPPEMHLSSCTTHSPR